MLAYARLAVVPVFLLVALCGCHGGSPSTLPVALPASILNSASFSVVVPGSAGGAPVPQSLVVSLLQVNGGTPNVRVAPFTMNLTLATPACVSQPGGSVACTAIVPAPVGTDTFELFTYAGPNGTGAQIATSQAKALVVAAGATPCPSSTPVKTTGPSI